MDDVQSIEKYYVVRTIEQRFEVEGKIEDHRHYATSDFDPCLYPGLKEREIVVGVKLEQH